MAANPLTPIVSYINKKNVNAARQIHFKELINPIVDHPYLFVYPLFIKSVDRSIILAGQASNNLKSYKHHPHCGIVIFSPPAPEKGTPIRLDTVSVASKYFSPGTVVLFRDPGNKPEVIAWHGTTILLLRENEVFSSIPNGLDYLTEIDKMLIWD